MIDGIVRGVMSVLISTRPPADPPPVPEPAPAQVKQSGSRALGYCMNVGCQFFHKGTFLMVRSETPSHRCPGCTLEGHLVRSTLATEDRGFKGYKTAIVHFDYSPALRKYQYAAIVELDEMVGGNVLIVEDPLISTKNRALKVAEMRLSAINAGDISVDGRVDWVTISFDSDDDRWAQQLEALELRGRMIHGRVNNE